MEVTFKNNYLYWKDKTRTKRAPYSERALAVLSRQGYDLKPLLTLGGGLKQPLYHYQFTSVVEAMKEVGGKARGSLLLADEMGVGKTASFIACMVAMQSKKTLIVVPSNVKLQWRRSLEAWIKNTPYIMICDGRNEKWEDRIMFKKAIMIEKAPVVIINYDILDGWLELLCNCEWDLLGIDESHKIKNSSALCTKAIKTLRERVKACICLSGTPLTDRNSDIFNSVWMVNPTLFPDEFMFHQRYCAGMLDEYNRASISTNTLELNRKLLESGTMLRRTKLDVYKELPKVSVEVVPMCNRTSALAVLETDALKAQKLAESLQGVERNRALFKVKKSLESYFQEAIRLKLPSIIKWAEDFLTETDSKLVLACVHRDKCGKILAEYFGARAILIDGSITAKKKDELLSGFINDASVRVLVGNIKSISAGIDGLQHVCSHMAVCELPWSPGDLQQLFARLDRNGQLNPVSIYMLTVYGSLDEMLAKLIDTKANVISEVLDGKPLEDIKKLMTLMNKHKGEEK